MKVYWLPVLIGLFFVIASGAYAQTPDVTNVALGKSASQSSTYMAGTEAAKAVDGSTGSITHTRNDNYAWWQVDLGASYSIDEIRIWNRADCCGDRLSNFYVFVSDEPFSTTDLGETLNQGVWNFYVPGQAGFPSVVPVGALGRYVRVQLSTNNWLSLGEVEVMGTSSGAQPSGFNAALSSNGGLVTASSTTPESEGHGVFHPEGAIDGDRKGLGWASGGAWRDGTEAAYPDWLEIEFQEHRYVNEINVFTLQDDYENPSEPTEWLTFSQYGITDFEVQYWDGQNWVTVPGGYVTGNSMVWRRFTFTRVLTDRVRVLVHGAAAGRSRIVEVEALGPETKAARPTVRGQQNNVALSANGARATASSDINSTNNASKAIDGNRKGPRVWQDNTEGVTAGDWLEVRFYDARGNGVTKKVRQVNVFSAQDNLSSTQEPTLEMTFNTTTGNGLVDFRVKYLHSETLAWTDLPGGIITNNNKVWKKIELANPVSARAIRVEINRTPNNKWSRVAELEAIHPTACPLPRELEDEIHRALTNEAKLATDPNYATVKWSGYAGEAAPAWQQCLDESFANWKGNGSQNLPVLSAAVGLLRMPNALMPNAIRKANNTLVRWTYAQWWANFLAYQVGAKTPQADGLDRNDRVSQFKGSEIFASIYDWHTMLGIVTAHYWSAKAGNASNQQAATVGQHAKAYLRANWFIYALSAGTGPARQYYVPEANWTLIDAQRRAPLKNDGKPRHPGHFLATAGSRSNLQYWAESNRATFFDRAVHYNVTVQNGNPVGNDSSDEFRLPWDSEGAEQQMLLDHMVKKWNSTTENLFGLTLSERNTLKSLTRTTGVPNVNLQHWLGSIRMSRTYRILGWLENGHQVRATVMEGNPNGNNPAMYAIKYEAGSGLASFAYPYTDKSSQALHHPIGSCTLDEANAVVTASQEGVCSEKEGGVCTSWAHPAWTLHMTIPPRSTRRFHLVLSVDAPAAWVN